MKIVDSARALGDCAVLVSIEPNENAVVVRAARARYAHQRTIDSRIPGVVFWSSPP